MRGKPWTSDGFRASWGKACKRAGIVGVTFHDLRGTAVTRLALVGCTEAQIATITGHSCATSARSSMPIISAAIRRRPIVRSGSSKREQKLPTDRPTGPRCSDTKKRKAK